MDDYSAIGAWKAGLENEKERYQRKAIEAMKSTDEYQSAVEADNMAKVGELIMRAKVQGMNEYNATKGAQLARESELALANDILLDTETDEAYWDAGYRKGQQFSKGLMAGRAANSTYTGDVEGIASLEFKPEGPGFAFGLNHVPRDNFPALLHQGERVLTASEAQSADQGGRSVIVDKLADTLVVREEADIYKIASALVREISRGSALALPAM